MDGMVSVIFAKKTGTVLASVLQRSPAKESPSLESLVGDALLVRAWDEGSSTTVQMSLPADELDVLWVKEDSKLINTPRSHWIDTTKTEKSMVEAPNPLRPAAKQVGQTLTLVFDPKTSFVGLTVQVWGKGSAKPLIAGEPLVVDVDDPDTAKLVLPAKKELLVMIEHFPVFAVQT